MALEKSKSIEAELQTISYEAEDETTSAKAPKSFAEKLKIIFCNITVEPILVFYVLPNVMSSLAMQNLNLEKACRVNYKFDEAICDALSARNKTGYNETDEQAVQKLVATINAYKNVIQSILPSFLLIFLGAWSDKHKRRKPCIMMPLVGEIVTIIAFICSVYFFYELPVEFNCFFEAVPPALTGGWFAMFMGVFSYISGISSVETRTLRIGAVNMFSNVSVTIGIAISGVLYKQGGSYGVFGFALSMYILGLSYAYFRVKEEGNPELKASEKGGLREFFDLKNVKDTFAVAFKEGKRNRKTRICTIMVLVMVIIGPLHGEMNVMYLFVRYRFGWDEVDYSLYSTFHFVAHLCGTIFSLMFFSKFLKFDDAVLGMISCSSKIASSFFYAFAPNTYVFYAGAIVEVLNGTSFIAMRSIMSKLVPPDELGKINSLFGVSEALMPLVYGPMYSMIYTHTINVLPGAFFLAGGALTAPAVIIFFWLYTEHRKDRLEDKLEKEQKEEFLKKEEQVLRE